MTNEIEVLLWVSTFHLNVFSRNDEICMNFCIHNLFSVYVLFCIRERQLYVVSLV